jgi:hypothetical protein
VTNEFDEKLKPDDSPQPESIGQLQSDRITRWILIVIGIYAGLLVTLSLLAIVALRHQDDVRQG